MGEPGKVDTILNWWQAAAGTLFPKEDIDKNGMRTAAGWK